MPLEDAFIDPRLLGIGGTGVQEISTEEAREFQQQREYDISRAQEEERQIQQGQIGPNNLQLHSHGPLMHSDEHPGEFLLAPPTRAASNPAVTRSLDQTTNCHFSSVPQSHPNHISPSDTPFTTLPPAVLAELYSTTSYSPDSRFDMGTSHPASSRLLDLAANGHYSTALQSYPNHPFLSENGSATPSSSESVELYSTTSYSIDSSNGTAIMTPHESSSRSDSPQQAIRPSYSAPPSHESPPSPSNHQVAAGSSQTKLLFPNEHSSHNGEALSQEANVYTTEHPAFGTRINDSEVLCYFKNCGKVLWENGLEHHHFWAHQMGNKHICDYPRCPESCTSKEGLEEHKRTQWVHQGMRKRNYEKARTTFEEFFPKD